jgi:hypothetical protein
LSRFSAVALICGVGVHIRLVPGLSLSTAGLAGVCPDNPTPLGLTPSVAGGNGDAAARVEFTAPTQMMFTPTTMGPRSGSGAGEDEVCGVWPRLTSRPEMRQGRNSTVELVLCRRWERMMPQDSSVRSTSRASGSLVGSVVLSAEGVAAGVRLWGSGEMPGCGVEPGVFV